MKLAAMFWAIVVLTISVAVASPRGTFQPVSSPRICAHRLGIQWTSEDGATERLAEFGACLRP